MLLKAKATNSEFSRMVFTLVNPYLLVSEPILLFSALVVHPDIPLFTLDYRYLYSNYC